MTDIKQFNDLDDVIQHFGVKGMKWGKRNTLKKAAKSYVKKRNAKEKASLDKYHEKKSGNKKYTKQYNALRKKGRSHTTAVKTVKRSDARRRRVYTKLALKAATPLIAKAAVSATSPEAVRAGKNIVQSLKRSPIRYVDGSKFKNVINM